MGAPPPGGLTRFTLPLLAIALGGVGARIAYVLTVARHVTLGNDAVAYQILGSELVGGYGYSDPTTLLTRGIKRPTANFPPGYPYFLAGIDKLGIHGTTGIELVGACLGVVTIVATGLLGRRISGRASVGLLAAALVALSPALISSAGSSMAETLSVPLTVLVLLAANRAARSRSLLPWIGVGALAGLLALVRSEDILVALLLVPAAILVVRHRSWRGQVARVTVAILAALVVISPWVVRNYTTFHPPVLVSTDAAKTLAGANCRLAYYGPLLGYWDSVCLGNDVLAATNEGRYEQALDTQGTNYIEAHLSRVPAVLAVRVLRAWGLYAPFQEARLAQYETRSVGWQQLAWPVSLLTLIVAVPGLVLVRRNRLALVLLAGPAVVDTLVVLTTYGNDRFVLSAVPSLCIAAAVTLTGLGRRLSRRPPARGEPPGAPGVRDDGASAGIAPRAAGNGATP